MEFRFIINGMTCNSCKQKVTEILKSLIGVQEVTIELEKNLAIVKTDVLISSAQIADALKAYPKYSIASEIANIVPSETRSLWSTYKPVLLIFIYLIIICTGIAWLHKDYRIMHWMNNFMAGFFLVFSFFKLLNLTGFANSYAMYDVVAKKWKPWGYIYPFVELGLGFAFMVQWEPIITNGITFVVMSVSLIGVVQTVVKKKMIKCACLGDIFNLPMSTVTIIEDSIMIVMSLWMLLQMV